MSVNMRRAPDLRREKFASNRSTARSLSLLCRADLHYSQHGGHHGDRTGYQGGRLTDSALARSLGRYGSVRSRQRRRNKLNVTPDHTHADRRTDERTRAFWREAARPPPPNSSTCDVPVGFRQPRQERDRGLQLVRVILSKLPNLRQPHVMTRFNDRYSSSCVVSITTVWLRRTEETWRFVQ